MSDTAQLEWLTRLPGADASLKHYVEIEALMLSNLAEIRRIAEVVAASRWTFKDMELARAGPFRWDEGTNFLSLLCRRDYCAGVINKDTFEWCSYITSGSWTYITSSGSWTPAADLESAKIALLNATGVSL